GAKNPGALTAARVRRQVAILSQLLLLEEGGGGGGGPTTAATVAGANGATKRLEEFLEREYHVTQNLMSGNSGDSFSDDSDAEAEKEEVTEKAAAAVEEQEEVVVIKRKGPGRPPRKKRGPVPSPVNSMLPVAHKRRSVQPKSVETHLKRNLLELRVPAKADCERCLELCPLLVSNHRDWRAIKF
ncbi:hypothetical protein CRUP_023649, partial [Coryphaenoides rupestris]